MKTFEITDKPYPNGLWSTPLNVVSYDRHIMRNEKLEKLESLIIHIIASHNPKCQLSINHTSSDGILIFSDIPMNTGWKMHHINLNKYYLNDTLLYFIENDVDLRKLKLEKLQQK